MISLLGKANAPGFRSQMESRRMADSNSQPTFHAAQAGYTEASKDQERAGLKQD
jgi:hypothetical protein